LPLAPSFLAFPICFPSISECGHYSLQSNIELYVTLLIW
jgi:hypothetical protein